jgi:hypothetical protein
LVFILIVLCLYSFATPIKLVEHERGHTSAGRRTGGQEGNVGDACRTHVDFSLFRFSFFRWPVLILQIFGQAIERSLPELAILLHPVSSLPERFGIKPHFVNASKASAPKQPCILKHAQMFRDCWKRHGVRFRQMGHTLIAPREMSQDTPPSRIGQSGKRAIQRSGRIFNHLVK